MKKRYMKLVVAIVILQAIVYTWVHLYLSYSVGMEIAPTTSVAFYTFCLGELSVCGLIKKKKGDCNDGHTKTTEQSAVG